MWLNRSVATINVMFQLLDIYRRLLLLETLAYIIGLSY